LKNARNNELSDRRAASADAKAALLDAYRAAKTAAEPGKTTVPVAEMACTWNTDLAMSSPIVVISSMDGSSHAVPSNTAILAHRDAGGGAVHSINSGS
jgi:hypothetical protein